MARVVCFFVMLYIFFYDLMSRVSMRRRINMGRSLKTSSENVVVAVSICINEIDDLVLVGFTAEHFIVCYVQESE